MTTPFCGYPELLAWKVRETALEKAIEFEHFAKTSQTLQGRTVYKQEAERWLEIAQKSEARLNRGP